MEIPLTRSYHCLEDAEGRGLSIIPPAVKRVPVSGPMLLVQLLNLGICISNSSEISLNVQKGSLGAKEDIAAAARVALI